MLALFISATVVAVERFINRRRLKAYEILRDVGWLTLLFAFIEFAYLFIVESATLNFGTAVRTLWYTEWPVFKSLLLEVAIGVFLVLTSVWLEQAGITSMPRISLRRAAPRLPLLTPPKPKDKSPTTSAAKCDVEW
jgi:hypothetical protein